MGTRRSREGGNLDRRKLSKGAAAAPLTPTRSKDRREPRPNNPKSPKIHPNPPKDPQKTYFSLKGT